MHDKLPVFSLLFNLLLAAVLQDSLPALAGLPVKIVLLTAVSLHASAFRPRRHAMLAAILAGGLTDVLGGLPPLCTVSFLTLMLGITRLFTRFLHEPRLPHWVLFTAATAMVQGIWTRFWIGGDGASALQTVARWCVLFASGAIAGGTGFAWCGLVDRLSGLKKPVEEDNGIVWAENNR